MTLDDRLKDNIGGDYGGIDLVEDDYTVLRLAILSDLNNIIGEDEPEIILGEQIPSAWHKNKLRQELRERVKKYCD